MSSGGGKNVVQNFLLLGGLVGCGLVMVGCGWWPKKLWLVVDGDGEIMAGRGWWL